MKFRCESDGLVQKMAIWGKKDSFWVILGLKPETLGVKLAVVRG